MTRRERNLISQIYKEWNSSPPLATYEEIEKIFINECETESPLWLRYTDIKSFEEPLCKKGLT